MTDLMSGLAQTPEPPYWTVIFASRRTDVDSQAYAEAARRMMARAAEQPGYLGADSARDTDGFGITVSYWVSEEAIAAWKADAEHLEIQRLGRQRWYKALTIRVARVERAQSFNG